MNSDSGDTTQIHKEDIADIKRRLTDIDTDNKTIIQVLKGNPEFKQVGLVDVLHEHSKTLGVHAEALIEVKKISEHAVVLKQHTETLEKHNRIFWAMSLVGAFLLALKDQFFVLITEIFTKK